MRIIILYAILMLSNFCTYGQNLVGLNGRDIQKYMKDNHKELNSEKVINDRFKYLKYSDSSNSQTLLFFLNNDSVCNSERFICDMSLKQDKVKEFDSIYKKSGNNRWVDHRDGKNYLIEIRDEKWSCVITIEPEK